MTYINEETGQEMEQPDWNFWTGVMTEEVIKEDGSIEVLLYCRPYTQEELAQKEAAVVAMRKAEQMPVAMELCVLQANLTDEQALQVDAFYPNWEPDQAYVTGDIRRYNSELYRILQDHTSQTDWTPDVTPSLYKKVGEPDPETGIEPWVQPTGDIDPYMTGDVVSHNEKVWTSDVDNNVWEPGVYGWTEKVESGE